MRFHPSSFTGKEKDEETGYGYFGARYMDHVLTTMWLSVDPMADKYPSISPYAYCAWNPIKLIDPEGQEAIASDDGWIVNQQTKTLIHVDSRGGNYSQTINYSDGQTPQTYFCKTADNLIQQYTQQGYTVEGYNPNALTLSPLQPYLGLYQNEPVPEPSFINGAKTGLGVGSTALGIGANVCYNTKLTGTWLGKNGKSYNMNFNGNGYTGGRLKFAKARSTNLTRLGTGLSVASFGLSAKQFMNNEISRTEFFSDAVSYGLGFVPEVGCLMSAAWQIGFKLGQKYGFLHNLFE